MAPAATVPATVRLGFDPSPLEPLGSPTRASTTPSALTSSLARQQALRELPANNLSRKSTEEEEDGAWSDEEDDDDHFGFGVPCPPPRDPKHYKAVVYWRAIQNAKWMAAQA